MVLPSGDQATLVIASRPGTRDVLDVARLDVDDREEVVAFRERDEGEALAVRRPRAGRLDEAQRLEVRDRDPRRRAGG